ncbi:hypothetical protein KUV85_07140 [Nocardioides panacisoli]|uniref:hypothetical protein n=1 Tax=Nocardioides panacisoli TaxID=627624 RepID=UPI001C635F80|nr:hypothetical protein [Nocardioides panacisoli]QYJ05449.1 hypothetical protein KUV85_07140 [Nocardioides panacisoli]
MIIGRRPDREIEAIVSALRERGPLGAAALQYEVGAKRWRAGRFRAALRTALAEGLVVRAGRRQRFAVPADAAADHHTTNGA